jgi:hypothetical protein
MKDWWRSLEEHLDEQSEQAPDPWSDRCHVDLELTEEQQRFLATLADQPAIVRMSAADPADIEP